MECFFSLRFAFFLFSLSLLLCFSAFPRFFASLRFLFFCFVAFLLFCFPCFFASFLLICFCASLLFYFSLLLRFSAFPFVFGSQVYIKPNKYYVDINQPETNPKSTPSHPSKKLKQPFLSKPKHTLNRSNISNK